MSAFTDSFGRLSTTALGSDGADLIASIKLRLFLDDSGIVQAATVIGRSHRASGSRCRVNHPWPSTSDLRMPPEGQRWSVPASLFEQGSRARYPELSHDASPGPSSMVLGSAGEDQETEVSIAKRGLHALFRDGTRHWLRTFVHAPGTRPTCEITGARHSVALLGSSDADFVFDPVSKIAHPHFLHLDTENLSRDALIEARAVEFCAPGQGTFEQPEGRTDIVKCVDVRWGDVDSEDERWLGAARDEVGVPQGSRLETDTPGSYTPMRVADTSGTGTPALEPVETGEHTDDESVGPILVDPGVPFGDQYTPTLGDGTRILPEPVIYQSDEDCTRLVIYRPDED